MYLQWFLQTQIFILILILFPQWMHVHVYLQCRSTIFHCMCTSCFYWFLLTFCCFAGYFAGKLKDIFFYQNVELYTCNINKCSFCNVLQPFATNYCIFLIYLTPHPHPWCCAWNDELVFSVMNFQLWASGFVSCLRMNFLWHFTSSFPSTLCVCHSWEAVRIFFFILHN